MNVYDLVSLAKEQNGYIEKKSNDNLDEKLENVGNGNYTKYGRDITQAGLQGYNGSAWECSLQFWLDLKIFGKDKALELWNMIDKYVGYNVISTYEVFAKNHKVGNVPKLGALVVFNCATIGRVINLYEVDDIQYIEYLEGNISIQVDDQPSGIVMIKRRSASSPDIKGYCYIDYEPVEETWVNQDGWKLYVNENICITNSWYENSDDRYYFDKDGFALQNSWLDFMGHRYWFKEDCCMATDCYIEEDDVLYHLNEHGVMDLRVVP